jgi:uncharacterized SAM-binding protein YcdF (DUF218 family)
VTNAPAAAGNALPQASAAAPAPSAPPAAQPRRRRRLAGAILLAALALLAGFGAFLAAALDPGEAPPGTTDGIVVLTGGSDRVATGFRLLAEGRARRMLISGAHQAAGLPEIAAAAGVDPNSFAGRVAVGHAAGSTRGNAVETAAWARAEEMRSLRVVTAAYHMPRAMLELRRALPGRDLLPHPVPSALLREPGALWRPASWGLLIGEYARYLGAWVGLSGLFASGREPRET